MARGTLLVRRSAAHRGLLVLVVLLVAAVAATLGTTLGAVRAAAVDGARQSIAQAEPAASRLVVVTRVALDEPGAAEAQDARVRAVVAETLPGVPLSVVREEVADPVGDAPFAHWTILPNADALAPGDLGVLAAEAERLHSVLREDDAVAVRGLVVEGGLPETAAAAHEALRAASAVTLVPVVLIGLIALVALVQVARLLATTREPEVGLLVSRGGSPAQVTTAALLEAAVLAVVAGAAGTAAAVGVLRLREASTGLWVPALVGLGVAVVAIAVLGIVAGLQVRGAARRQVTDRSGRVRQAAALGTVVLTVVLAVVCLAQLLRYGSPLVVTPMGVRTDPLGAAAPALVLAALAVAAMAVLGPVTRGWAAHAARGTGATGVLAARQVARRLVVFVVPVVMLVLAAGTATLAGSYAATSHQLRTDVAALRNGADVRVVLPSEGPVGSELPPAQAAPFAELEGAAAAAPVLALEATADSEPVAVSGIGVEALTDVVRVPPGTVDVAGLATTLAADPFADAPVVPDGSTELTLSASGTAVALPFAEFETGPSATAIPDPEEVPPEVLAEAEEGAGVDLRLWLAAPDGTLTLVDAGRFDYDLDGDGDGQHPLGARARTYEVQVPLPGSADGWRLVGADLLVAGPDLPLDVALSIEAITAAAPSGPAPVDLTDSTWSSAPEVESSSLEIAVADRVLGATVHTMQRTTARIRLVHGDGAPVPVPTAVTAPLAGRFGLTPGDALELTIAGARVPVEVAAVVDVVPGDLQRFAAVMDLSALDATLLRSVRDLPRPAEVWVAAEEPRTGDALDALAGSVAGVAGDGATVTTSQPSSGDVDAAAPVRSTFTLAAAGAAVLALVGVAAVAVAMLRARRHEVVVLRAVGVSPRRQGRGRALELAVVGGVALLVGLAAGVLVARLVVGGLARATLTGVAAVPDVTLRTDVWAVAVPLLVLAAGLAVTAAGVGARVAAQARDTEYREEVR